MTIWKRERDIVVDDGHHSEEQVSKVWSRRFYLADNPWTDTDGEVLNSVVTVSWWVERHAKDNGRYRIMRETEYMICTDPDQPGHTERLCYYAHDYEGIAPFTLSMGEIDAEIYARRYMGDWIDWDGRTPKN